MSEQVKKFNDLTLYLGQLEYNIQKSEKTLKRLKDEKKLTINELAILEDSIESTSQVEE